MNSACCCASIVLLGFRVFSSWLEYFFYSSKCLLEMFPWHLLALCGCKVGVDPLYRDTCPVAFLRAITKCISPCVPLFDLSPKGPGDTGRAAQDGAGSGTHVPLMGSHWLTSRTQGKACLLGGGAGSTHRWDVDA